VSVFCIAVSRGVSLPSGYFKVTFPNDRGQFILQPIDQITTVIPTYRRPLLLKRAITSVLAQNYRDFEVHVYDNASGDDTQEVAQQFASRDSRVKYFCHPRNIGLIQNFAYGIRHVESPFFNLLSDDDVLLPNFFETAVSALNRAPTAMLFVGTLVEMDGYRKLRSVQYAQLREGLHHPPEAFFSVLNSGPNTWTSTLFRREVATSLGGLDERLGLPADIDFELRAMARYPLVAGSRVCAVFFQHQNSASVVALTSDALIVAMLQMITNVDNDPHISSEMKPALCAAMRDRFRHLVFIRARVAADQGAYDEATKLSGISREHFGARATAGIVDMLASPGFIGQVARAGFRAARIPVRLLRRFQNHRRYNAESRLCVAALESLERAVAAPDGGEQGHSGATMPGISVTC